MTEFGGRPEDGKELPKKVCIQLKLIIASIQQFEQTLCHYNANIEGITFITCPESIWVIYIVNRDHPISPAGLKSTKLVMASFSLANVGVQGVLGPAPAREPVTLPGPPPMVRE